MNVPTFTINGTKEDDIELPLVFSTSFRKDLISKSFTHLNSHKFQPQGTHPTAGMDVVARSNDPPTGQGRSRIAKMRGGGGGRQGEAGGVASVKGGRQAHPPKVQKVIFKNWPDAIDAVMDHFQTPGGIPGFGDWSDYLDEFDPFRDGKAAYRMGTYLKWLIQGFEDGLDREIIMADAAERYAHQWGNDKVIFS